MAARPSHVDGIHAVGSSDCPHSDNTGHCRRARQPGAGLTCAYFSCHARPARNSQTLGVRSSDIPCITKRLTQNAFHAPAPGARCHEPRFPARPRKRIEMARPLSPPDRENMASDEEASARCQRDSESPPPPTPPPPPLLCAAGHSPALRASEALPTLRFAQCIAPYLLL